MARPYTQYGPPIPGAMQSRKWQKANPEKKRATQKRYIERRRRRALDLLGGRCANCGVTEGLEFDHVDPTSKSFTITARLSGRWDALQAELAKCQLLCASCHDEKTWTHRRASA